MFNLVILEDCQLYCDGLCGWLSEEKSIRIYKDTGDWNIYQQIARELKEFITVTSLYWIDTHPGVDVFTSFHKSHPSISVYCVNLKNHDLRSVDLFQSEINGFVTRQATKEEFIFGLKEVIKGRFYMSAEPAGKANGALNGSSNNHKVPQVVLTKREIEILDMISLGYSDKEIGNKLIISKRTVDGYRHNLLIKFGARNSPHLVKSAIAGNYIANEPGLNEK